MIGFWIFLLAAFLDVVDGYAARKFYQETKLGAILDPLVDKVLLISAFICLHTIGASWEIIRFPYGLLLL